ncbi:MAG: hypothetical protein Q8L19_18215 [Reyranella sp.]|nr:hypothetical protein [Reyranella sp.]
MAASAVTEIWATLPAIAWTAALTAQDPLERGMPTPRPNAVPGGLVVVNVTDTVPPDVKVKSLLAALPGLITLENELTSIDVSDGDVIIDSLQAAAIKASPQIVAILILMDGSRES